MRSDALLCAALSIAGCAHYTSLSAEDREGLQRELTREQPNRFLRLSYYVTPFFGDSSKRLLTPTPPGELHLVNDLGQRVRPGGVERVLPAGTTVRVLKIEFPTAWVVAHRPADTPRSLPWVYLQTTPSPSATPLILLLPSHIDSVDMFKAELDLYASVSDPSASLSRWSEPVREAVRTKNAIPDMPDDALEMAWGYPERKRVSYDGSTRNEEWIYSSGARVAYLVDSRLSTWSARTRTERAP
jgi:hypothetical protein